MRHDEVPIEAVASHIKRLQGKILTIIETTLPRGSQQVSTKSLIKSEFNQALNTIRSLNAPPEIAA